MKEVAIVLLAALMLNGCGSTTTVQTPTSAIWSAVLTGGSGDAPDPSFNTQFTLNGDGSLNITFIQFLTQQPCFAVAGGTESGQATLQINSSNYAVTGTLTYTVQSGNNTLSLNGLDVTGTELGTTLTNALVTGTWTATGDPGCVTSGTFTMTQCISGACTPIP